MGPFIISFVCNTCPYPIADGGIAETPAPALLDFLNPEPCTLSPFYLSGSYFSRAAAGFYSAADPRVGVRTAGGSIDFAAGIG
jgi:hypothetical protein